MCLKIIKFKDSHIIYCEPFVQGGSEPKATICKLEVRIESYIQNSLSKKTANKSWRNITIHP
jgi:hypothetical protein